MYKRLSNLPLLVADLYAMCHPTEPRSKSSCLRGPRVLTLICYKHLNTVSHRHNCIVG